MELEPSKHIISGYVLRIDQTILAEMQSLDETLISEEGIADEFVSCLEETQLVEEEQSTAAMEEDRVEEVETKDGEDEKPFRPYKEGWNSISFLTARGCEPVHPFLYCV